MKLVQKKRSIQVLKHVYQFKLVHYFYGRFPSGRAIRYIFFTCSRQKRMPLLSLTLHPINFETKVATPDNQVSKNP